jgi:hypothetical protein
MPANIPKGITRDDVLNGIVAYKNNTPSRFIDSTKYDLIYKGEAFPPKAILGLSAMRLNAGKPLVPSDFSAGESSKCFSILRELGFTISIKKGFVFDSDYTDEDWESSEGAVVYRSHKSYERDPQLAKKKKELFYAEHGRVFCEGCGFDFESKYGERGAGYIECHHITPVSQLKEGEVTKLSDLALVCSNCHRMIHRKSPWLTMAELKEIKV